MIERPSQVRLLASPVRQEVIDGVQALGACTVAELAASLGRRADSLYYHVGALERAGLLVRVGVRRSGRRAGAVFDVPGRPMRLAYRLDDAGQAAGVTAIVSSLLRLARRDFARAIGSAGAGVGAPARRANHLRAEGPLRNIRGSRLKGWLTDAELRRFNALVERALRVVQDGRRRPGTRQYAVVLVVSPAEPAPRRARNAARAAPSPRRAPGDSASEPSAAPQDHSQRSTP